MNTYGLGCLFKDDKRDYPVSLLKAMVDDGTVEPVAWETPVHLNQGGTPHCVGFASAGFWSAAQVDAPCKPDITNEVGHDIYYRCKVKDGEPGAENGSYVRSGLAVLKDLGVIDAYSPNATFAEANDWVQRYGPVIIGIPWRQDMFNPDANGVIHSTGAVAGGHAILWMGDRQGPADNALYNSWFKPDGTPWGDNSRCYISDQELQPLIDYQGSAGMGVKIVKVPWSDWGDQDRMAAVYVHTTGAMMGLPDGTFRPYDQMTFRHVALVAHRVGLAYPQEWLDSHQITTRGAIRDTFPGFTWTEQRWNEPLLRRHMCILLWRWLKGRNV